MRQLRNSYPGNPLKAPLVPEGVAARKLLRLAGWKEWPSGSFLTTSKAEDGLDRARCYPRAHQPLTPYLTLRFKLYGRERWALSTMKPNKPQMHRPFGALGAGAAGAGAALVAVFASSCCIPVIAPLIVAVLGASGAAWAAGLKPYSPYILAGSLALLLYGMWTVYRPRPECAPEGCATGAGRGVKAVLWVAMSLWTLSALVNLILPGF